MYSRYVWYSPPCIAIRIVFVTWCIRSSTEYLMCLALYMKEIVLNCINVECNPKCYIVRQHLQYNVMRSTISMILYKNYMKNIAAIPRGGNIPTEYPYRLYMNNRAIVLFVENLHDQNMTVRLLLLVGLWI